jgi:soluble lytic murein transglycosylase
MQMPDTYFGGMKRKEESLADAIMQASEEHDVPASLIGRVLRIEGGGPGVESSAGALGNMQLMPKLIQSYGQDVQQVRDDPTLNISLGTRYLSELLQRFGRPEYALAAYNAGPTRLSRILSQYGKDWKQFLPLETRNYLRK